MKRCRVTRGVEETQSRSMNNVVAACGALSICSDGRAARVCVGDRVVAECGVTMNTIIAVGELMALMCVDQTVYVFHLPDVLTTHALDSPAIAATVFGMTYAVSTMNQSLVVNGHIVESSSPLDPICFYGDGIVGACIYDIVGTKEGVIATMVDPTVGIAASGNIIAVATTRAVVVIINKQVSRSVLIDRLFGVSIGMGGVIVCSSGCSDGNTQLTMLNAGKLATTKISAGPVLMAGSSGDAITSAGNNGVSVWVPTMAGTAPITLRLQRAIGTSFDDVAAYLLGEHADGTIWWPGGRAEVDGGVDYLEKVWSNHFLRGGGQLSFTVAGNEMDFRAAAGLVGWV